MGLRFRGLTAVLWRAGLREFDFEGTDSGDGQFEHSDAISVDANGAVWVGDEGNGCVQVFTEAGEYITKFRLLRVRGIKFAYPMSILAEGTAKSGSPMPTTTSWRSGLGVDSKGNVWVADSGNNRVEVFNHKGEYITKFGTPGSENERMKFPVALALNFKGNIWVTDNKNQIDHWIR